MSAPRRCASCGAEAPRPAALFCEHCGAALPALEAPAPPPPDPFGDVAARFRALASHPELARRLAQPPPVPELQGRFLPSLLLLLLLGALGTAASFVFLGLCPPVGFALVAACVVGVLVVGRQLIRNALTPLSAVPALVVEVRARLQAGAEHSPSSTRHFVTLQLEDGSRRELEGYASALPDLEPGAMGVVYVKGERLAAFAPLDVRTA